MRKNTFTILLIISFLIFRNLTFTQSMAQNNISGSLVIVGGALGSDNAEIYHKFIALAGGVDKAKVAIIPAASTKPVHYAQMFKNDLVKYGVFEKNIDILPIATKDDNTTDQIDEGKWAENADNKDIAERIKNYSAFWFTGGDQTRITEVMVRKDGSRTDVLEEIWTAYQNGAVIGGTSAGAAIMSEVMIGGGSSYGSLRYGFSDKYIETEQQEYGAAYIDKGLGFFTFGIIDQHFDRKARLGRLIIVNMKFRNQYQRSFGVDENTALVVYNSTQTIEAIGMGGVTIIDVSTAKTKEKSKYTNFTDIEISYIEERDKFDLKTGEFHINPVKAATVGKEFLNIPQISATGVMSPNGSLKQLITYHLVDNSGVSEVKSYCFGEDNIGFELVFRKTPETKGFWAYMNGQIEHYSAIKVKLDIKPIKIQIKHLK